MAQHDVKVDSTSKILAAIGVVLLLITLGYLLMSLVNAFTKGSGTGEMAVAPTTEAPKAEAPAPAPAETAAPAPKPEAQVASAPAAATPAAPSTPAPAAETPAPAAAAPAAGDPAAGKAKFATCAACHGANGEGSGIFPKLAGLSAADVEAKLKQYRAGEQVGPMTSMMAPNAANLSDADIADLSAYIATL